MKTRMIAATVMLLVACGASREQGSARAQSTQQFSSLDQLLAPIALYPDSLLAQILMCSSDPPKMVELDAFLAKNKSLKGTQLQDAAVKAGFEPSFVALSLFPQVVTKMASDSKWTNLLGQAFAADKTKVFESIQRLRHQAQEVGTLKTNAQQEVTTKTTSGGEEVIVIEPANPQIIYVPQYNTEVVYTQAPPVNTTVVVQQDNSADEAVAAGLIGFTAGIAIGASMNNNYYYGPYGWHGGAYMYNDAWDDYYDAREDAREDWADHREDLNEERTDRSENRQEQRTDRTETRAENRPENAQRAQNAANARAQGATAQGASTQSASGRTGSAQARGYSGGSQAAQRSGSSSDAFSGYSSGSSQRASSSRGASSRASSSRGASRGGGGRRR